MSFLGHVSNILCTATAISRPTLTQPRDSSTHAAQAYLSSDIWKDYIVAQAHPSQFPRQGLSKRRTRSLATCVRSDTQDVVLPTGQQSIPYT